MAITYATKYSPVVDERFTQVAFTNGLVNNDYDWLGTEAIKVYSIPTTAMNDYSLTGTSRYGTPSELQNTVQTMLLTKDRSFVFTIDRKSYTDTQMVMEAGKALRRQIDEVVTPEIDAYRLATLVSGCPIGNVKTLAVTSSNAYAEFLAVQGLLDEAKAPQFGRVVIATPAYINLLKQDSAFTKSGDMATTISMNGVVGEIDGVPVIKVASTYFPANVDFIVTNPMVMPSPMKLIDYKIHEDAPGISGWLVEGRIRYDAFVLSQKAGAIGVHKNA